MHNKNALTDDSGEGVLRWTIGNYDPSKSRRFLPVQDALTNLVRGIALLLPAHNYFEELMLK